MFKKAMTVLFTLVVLSSATALGEALVEAGGELGVLSETSTDVSVATPFNNLLRDEYGNFTDYYRIYYTGYYDLAMTVDGTDESGNATQTVYDLRMYIPEGSHYAQTSILLAVPSGVDPYQFMVDSGWKDVADEKKASIFLLMPTRVKDENGVATAWGTWGEDAADYIAAAVKVIGQRPGIETISYCEYMLGYGDAADIVAQYVIDNPSSMAGAFVVGTTGAVRLPADDVPSKVAGVPLNKVPLPMGIVSNDADVSAMVAYFKHANTTFDEAEQVGSFDVYTADPSADVGQPNDEPVANVYTLKASTEDCMNAEFAAEVHDILIQCRRYPGYLNSHLRAYENVYDSEHYEHYTSLSALGHLTYGGEGNGNYYNREWWLYVPDSAKERMENGEKVEVVFVLMGSNGYGDEADQRTGWDLVAEREGFVIVSPSGHVRHQGNFGVFVTNGVPGHQFVTNWNWVGPTSINPDDLQIISEIHDWLFTRCKYAEHLDESRVYMSGQSAGGAFVHYVGQNLPDLFTAIAPCSFLSAYDVVDTSSDVPTMVLMGQQDTTAPEGFNSETGKMMFTYTVVRYGGLKDAEGRDSYDDFTFSQEKEGGTSIFTKADGAMQEYIMQTSNGVPMYVQVEVVGMSHATLPEECDMIWDTFFSHFSKDPQTKVLYYDGEVVDTPVNEALADAQ